MDQGWPAGRDAPGSSLRPPRPGRQLVVPGPLPAGVRRGPVRGWVSAPRNASTSGA